MKRQKIEKRNSRCSSARLSSPIYCDMAANIRAALRRISSRVARQEGCTEGLVFALLRRRGDALRYERRQPAATFAVDPMTTDAVGSLRGRAQSAVADGVQGPHAPCQREALSSTDHGRRSLAL